MILLRRILILMVLVALGGCASRQVAAPLPEQREMLFPYGIYKQKVSLALPDAANASGFSGHQIQFNGVAQIRADLIRVVILSHFGTTVAKIEENRVTGEVKTEIYAAAMKKHEDRVQEYYSVLKHVLLAPAQADKDPHLHWLKKDEQGRPLEIETEGFDHNATFRLASYDEHGIPARISIDRLGNGVKVEVEVTGYDL